MDSFPSLSLARNDKVNGGARESALGYKVNGGAREGALGYKVNHWK